MSIKQRLRKLEVSRSKFNTMEFIVTEKGDDNDDLLYERYGADGPPVGVEVFFVRTGVPRCR